MLKHFKKKLSNQRSRTGIIITASLILIAALFTFTELELQHNRQLVISNYAAQQQEITNQAAARLNLYLTSQTADVDTAIKRLISEVKTGGSSYWFITENDTLLFVKDTSDSDQFGSVSPDTFIQQKKAEKMKITTSSFTAGSNRFLVGNCTKLDFIEEEGQLFRHNIFVIFPMILVIAFFFVLFIYGLNRISRLENIIHQLKSEAVERNIAIEQLSSQIRKSRLNQLGNTGKAAEKGPCIYSKEVLATLLEKLEKEKIVPLTILIIEFEADKQNEISNEYEKYIKSISKIMNHEHVLAQVLPNVYTVLVFHTSEDENNSMKEALIKKWVIPLKDQGIKPRIGITRIEDDTAEVRNIFNTIYNEVLRKTTI